MAGDAGSEAAADDSRFRPRGGKHAAPSFPPLFNIAHIAGIAGIRVIRRPQHARLPFYFLVAESSWKGSDSRFIFMASAGAMFGSA